MTESAAKPRCTLCNYKHGHCIGCPNNPVDIALKDAAAQPAAEVVFAKAREIGKRLAHWEQEDLIKFARSIATPLAAQPAAAEASDDRGERLWAETLHAAQPRHHEIREAARSAGAFMHRDGNICFTNAHQLHCAILALAAPAQPAPEPAASSEKCADCALMTQCEYPACVAPEPAADAGEVERAARTAVDAYESRFESIEGRYNGPIDEEMKALAAALKGLEQ